MIREIVTGFKSLDSFEQDGLDEDVKARISDYCLVMLKIKKKIGAARMSVLTKNLEFIRVIYGGPRSEFVIIVMYVCQRCGWAPKYDYDYCVIPCPKGRAIWYCAKGGGVYDKHMMLLRSVSATKTERITVSSIASGCQMESSRNSVDG